MFTRFIQPRSHIGLSYWLTLVICLQPLVLQINNCRCVPGGVVGTTIQSACCDSIDITECKCNGGCQCSVEEQVPHFPNPQPPATTPERSLFSGALFVAATCGDSIILPSAFRNPVGFLPSRSALQTCVLLERFRC